MARTGCFVVNIGDMLEIWTNGLWQSTKHRVVHRSGNLRVSVPFFYEPDLDAVIEPLEKCVERTGGKKLYERKIYGTHLVEVRNMIGMRSNADRCGRKSVVIFMGAEMRRRRTRRNHGRRWSWLRNYSRTINYLDLPERPIVSGPISQMSAGVAAAACVE